MEEKIFRPSRNKLKDTLIKNKRRKSIFTTPILLITIILFIVLFFITGKGPDLSAKTDNYISSKSNHSKITFTGDISPSRFLKPISEKNGKDVFYRDIKKVWADSDVTLINLESVVVNKEMTEENYPELKDRTGKILLDTSKDDLQAIKESGINLIGFANNHSQDFGVQGMLDTMDTIDNLGLNRIGVGRNLDEAIQPYISQLNGKNITFTAITEKLPLRTAGGGNVPRVFTASNLYLDYELNRTFSKGDFNIVYIHWGTEYALAPDKEIKELGKKLIDLGADMVIGSHPHVLLPLEKYNDGIIIYSMGNLVFDQTIGRTAFSAIGSLYLNDNERFLEFVPVKLENGIPFIEEENSSIFNRVFSTLTKNLDDADYSITEGKIKIEF